MAVALADKLDTLVAQFFAIGEVPERDRAIRYALRRRSAIGIICHLFKLNNVRLSPW